MRGTQFNIVDFRLGKVAVNTPLYCIALRSPSALSVIRVNKIDFHNKISSDKWPRMLLIYRITFNVILGEVHRVAFFEKSSFV